MENQVVIVHKQMPTTSKGQSHWETTRNITLLIKISLSWWETYSAKFGMMNFSIFILCLRLLIWERVRTKCCNTQTCYIFYSHFFTRNVWTHPTKILKEIQNQIPSWRLISFTGTNHTSSRETWTSDHQMKPLVLRICASKCHETQTS